MTGEAYSMKQEINDQQPIRSNYVKLFLIIPKKG